MWTKVATDGDGLHYSVLGLDLEEQGMDALRQLFPTGEADTLNFCLFSTSGICGTYTTIEEAESSSPDENGNFWGITFVVIHPRVVAIRAGNCVPKTEDDFVFLKRLRDTSRKAMLKIGINEQGE